MPYTFKTYTILENGVPIAEAEGISPEDGIFELLDKVLIKNHK